MAFIEVVIQQVAGAAVEAATKKTSGSMLGVGLKIALAIGAVIMIGLAAKKQAAEEAAADGITGNDIVTEAYHSGALLINETGNLQIIPNFMKQFATVKVKGIDTQLSLEGSDLNVCYTANQYNYRHLVTEDQVREILFSNLRCVN